MELKTFVVYFDGELNFYVSWPIRYLGVLVSMLNSYCCVKVKLTNEMAAIGQLCFARQPGSCLPSNSGY